MKIELDKINELCLPYMKRPRRIIGAKVVVLTTIRNKAGEVFERATICRRVAELREAGILHVDHVGLDPLTDTKAEFLAL